MKKIYIAGGGGMLGEAFRARFGATCQLRITDIDTSEDWIDYLDFRDAAAYEEDVVSFQPDYLFHLGAHTSLEYCEQHPDDAYATNTVSVQTAVNISRQLDIPLLYISTAGIFDGKKESYSEEDLPNPMGQYARTKYLGEQYVLAHHPNHLVCRAGWMMGGGPGKDKKFVGKLMQQLIAGNTTLQIVNDRFGTPTYTHDFANNVYQLLEAGKTGLFNMVCAGETSRLEVAQELLRILNLSASVTINEVESTFFGQEYFAPRPVSERLINKRLKSLQMDTMRDWKTCLKEYLANYYCEYFTD